MRWNKNTIEVLHKGRSVRPFDWKPWSLSSISMPFSTQRRLPLEAVLQWPQLKRRWEISSLFLFSLQSFSTRMISMSFSTQWRPPPEAVLQQRQWRLSRRCLSYPLEAVLQRQWPPPETILCAVCSDRSSRPHLSEPKRTTLSWVFVWFIFLFQKMFNLIEFLHHLCDEVSGWLDDNVR